MRARGRVIAGLLLAVGCGGDDAPPPPPPSAVADVVVEGDGAMLGHPPVNVPHRSRAVKRLTVMQLARSIPVVAGEGMEWSFGNKSALGDDSAFGPLDRTLGRPDYYFVTEEPAQPTALYLKFMDDMARHVCSEMVLADGEAASPEDRILAPHVPMDSPATDEDIRTNLRYLALRFWGQWVHEDDDETLADLEALYHGASQLDPSEEPIKQMADGWRAVCVALMTSPAFHLY